LASASHWPFFLLLCTGSWDATAAMVNVAVDLDNSNAEGMLQAINQ
jgi:hypothetical protein